MDLASSALPVVSFIAGISGSLHCVGMCGGLVSASCNNGKEIGIYQVGRLLGYLVLGSVAWSMGYILKSVVPFSWGPELSGVMMGALFIYWGVQSYSGKKAEVPFPHFFRKIYQLGFRKFVVKADHFKSFLVGLLSVLLPCGLIYGFVIGILGFGNYEQILFSLLFFWLGTLPAMLMAPHLIKKILEPFRKKLPKVYAIFFILLGVATIASRLSNTPHSHDADHSVNNETELCNGFHF